MKKIFKGIFNAFCFVISIFCCNLLGALFKRIKYGVTTQNFKRKLKKHGKNISIKDGNSFEGLNRVEIGNDFYVGQGLWLATYGDKKETLIKIGNNVSCSRYCHIGATNGIEIKDDVLIGSNVLITDHSHGNTFDFSIPRNKLELTSKGKVSIGKNCWIGDNVVILPNVTIGDNCVIGANSVVNKSFESNSLIAGNPAKAIKRITE